MSEKPVERLNYYNGQRLEARDFKLEQEYHIRVRRWLNKSLYSAGIASGLEVREEPDTLNVIVSPGLALDADGREILLWEEQRVPVQSHSGSSDATVEGNYLVIEYRDEKYGTDNGACSTRGKPDGRESLAWGGPARIRSMPLLSWSSVLPHETSGKIVLAQVELEPLCAGIHQINTRVRRYVGAASEAKVRQYALDGERDIDPANPGRIYFHIRGRQPNGVTLYLRAEKFSTLYYTEMGKHKHALDVQLAGGDGRHRHDLGSHSTSEHTGHQHSVANDFLLLEQPEDAFFDLAKFLILGPAGVFLNKERTEIARKIAITPQYHVRFTLAGNSLSEGDYPPIVPNHPALPPLLVSSSGAHRHTYGSDPAAGVTELTKDGDASSDHTHAFRTAAAGFAGVNDPSPSPPATQLYSSRTGAPLSFVNDLQIFIGKSGTQLDNKTPAILSQLRAAQSTTTWPRLGLGTGSSTSPIDTLATDGTGEIKLDFLPDIAFTEGEYVIELRVLSGGGRILYNLYVE